MDERDKLIYRLKMLVAASDIKQEQYRKENNLSEGFGCITRETFAIAFLIPQMNRLGITFDDLTLNGG
jgi:hypothetical protein